VAAHDQCQLSSLSCPESSCETVAIDSKAVPDTLLSLLLAKDTSSLEKVCQVVRQVPLSMPVAKVSGNTVHMGWWGSTSPLQGAVSTASYRPRWPSQWTYPGGLKGSTGKYNAKQRPLPLEPHIESPRPFNITLAFISWHSTKSS
jgi:hypothetical protein